MHFTSICLSRLFPLWFYQSSRLSQHAFVAALPTPDVFFLPFSHITSAPTETNRWRARRTFRARPLIIHT